MLYRSTLNQMWTWTTEMCSDVSFLSKMIKIQRTRSFVRFPHTEQQQLTFLFKFLISANNGLFIIIINNSKSTLNNYNIAWDNKVYLPITNVYMPRITSNISGWRDSDFNNDACPDLFRSDFLSLNSLTLKSIYGDSSVKLSQLHDSV